MHLPRVKEGFVLVGASCEALLRCAALANGDDGVVKKRSEKSAEKRKLTVGGKKFRYHWNR
jgi:hypothetical protein